MPNNVIKLSKGVHKKRAKRPHWYRMEAFFEKDAKTVMKIGEEDIVLCGWVPPYNDVAVCVVPPSITQQQGLALQKILEANLRAPVLVLTNNTQLVRLKQISDTEAQKIIKEGQDGIVHVSQEEGPEDSTKEDAAAAGKNEAKQRGQLRAADSNGAEGDLRPAGAGQADGDGAGQEVPKGILPTAQGEQCEPGGADSGSETS